MIKIGRRKLMAGAGAAALGTVIVGRQLQVI